MILMKMKTHASILVLGAAMSLAPALAFSADAMDSAFHSQVSNKVQQDHVADVKSGKVAKRGSHQASNQSNSSASGTASTSAVSAAAGGTSGTIAHPAQVKQAQKKQATPPPKAK